MFYSLRGQISHICASYVVCENQNIGYIIKTPNPFQFSVGTVETFYTHVYMREQIIDIYGFTSVEERELFLKLISVKGIGPKGALAILASNDLLGLNQAITQADAKYLQRFPGIGPKASNQIILDLKGKLVSLDSSSDNPKISDVKEALRSLGYKNQELKRLTPVLEKHLDEPIEALIKIALKHLF
mgnify:CR=1 FL=1